MEEDDLNKSLQIRDERKKYMTKNKLKTKIKRNGKEVKTELNDKALKYIIDIAKISDSKNPLEMVKMFNEQIRI